MFGINFGYLSHTCGVKRDDMVTWLHAGDSLANGLDLKTIEVTMWTL